MLFLDRISCIDLGDPYLYIDESRVDESSLFGLTLLLGRHVFFLGREEDDRDEEFRRRDLRDWGEGRAAVEDPVIPLLWIKAEKLKKVIREFYVICDEDQKVYYSTHTRRYLSRLWICKKEIQLTRGRGFLKWEKILL